MDGPLGVIIMRPCKAKLIMLVFSIFYLSPTLGAGDLAYVRVESCQYTDCVTTDCGWIPGWRSYCVWTMDLGYYDCTGERIHGGLDSFRRAPENYPDHLWECIGCEESGPYYVYRPECHPKGWYYLSSNTLFGDWDCHRGGVLDLRTPEMIEAQKAKAELLQRMMEASSDEVLEAMIRENDSVIDADLLRMLAMNIEIVQTAGQEADLHRVEGCHVTGT